MTKSRYLKIANMPKFIVITSIYSRHKDLDKFNFRKDQNSKLHSILNKSTKSICLGLTQWYGKSKSIRIINYWNKIRLIKPKLNTDDLFSIGIQEGPILGKIKKELEMYAIDYPDTSIKEQRGYAVFLYNEELENERGPDYDDNLCRDFII